MTGNRETYERPDVVTFYDSKSGLHVAEQRIFDRWPDLFRGRRVLEIGVGAGRTVAHVSGAAAHYVGIDFSEALLERARAANPGVDLRWGDARDLALFPDQSVDTVFFSFNGIDELDHEGRLLALHEIGRVLAPGGAFLFSSHNRDFERLGLMPWQGRPKLGRTMVRRSAFALRHSAERRRMRRLEQAHEDYALVNDDAHGYSLLHYYIGSAAQVRQLERLGFEVVETTDQQGVPSGAEGVSVWRYYLTRRP